MSLYSTYDLSFWAEKTPDKTAVFDTRLRMSYRSLHERSLRLAAYLQSRGLKKGDRLLASLPNCCEAVELMFAVKAVGIVLVPFNTQYKHSEIDHIIKLTAPAMAVVCIPQQAEYFRGAYPSIPLVELGQIGSEDMFEPFIESMEPVRARMPELCDPALIVCTSGSTGEPKGALLSYGNMFIPGLDITKSFRITQSDVTFIPVPLCHMFGIMGVVVTLGCGSTIVMMQKFRETEALHLIESERVSVQFCVASMYEREIAEYESAAAKPDISSLRTGMIAGAPSIRTCIEWFDKNAGCRLLNAYGLTEAQALAGVDFDDPEDVRYTTAGHASPHCKLKIVCDDETECAVGETGEIVCSSPGIMLGYYGHPELTAKSYTSDGFFKTGDLGRVDAQGYLTVTGRKKDLIIRGGYNVFPYEIESMYNAVDGISEVCVVGYPDEVLGERIAAYIVPKAGFEFSPERLRGYALENIAKYKVPDKIILTDGLPKLSNCNLDKLSLKRKLTE